jgi:hypothetical protein
MLAGLLRGSGEMFSGNKSDLFQILLLLDLMFYMCGSKVVT